MKQKVFVLDPENTSSIERLNGFFEDGWKTAFCVAQSVAVGYYGGNSSFNSSKELKGKIIYTLQK